MSKMPTGFKDDLDGLSNTIMGGEFNTDLGDLEIATVASTAAFGSAYKTNPAWGQASISSRHQVGAHVLMGDGAVKFITDSIEAGCAPSDPWQRQMTG